MSRRHVALAAGRFLLDALSGKLGAPIMVVAYVTFSMFLLAYVSTQVYTHSLMESVAGRKRTRLSLEERIGVLTAQYATMTSKSRVSRRCEDAMGMVSATMNDVVRVAVDDAAATAPGAESRVPVSEVSGGARHDLTWLVDE